MNLWTLYRRRKLAYELLADYDYEPPSYEDDSLAKIAAFHAATESGAWAVERWRESVEKAAERYPDA